MTDQTFIPPFMARMTYEQAKKKGAYSASTLKQMFKENGGLDKDAIDYYRWGKGRGETNLQKQLGQNWDRGMGAPPKYDRQPDAARKRGVRSAG